MNKIESQEFWERWFIKGSNIREAFKDSRVDIGLITEEFRSLSSADVDGGYLFSLYKKAKPFVLPALAKDDSVEVN